MSNGTITFNGAAKTVTGSRHLITVQGKNVLVDCGLFQGPSEIRKRNWDPFPINPAEIDAVVITHAHMDHIGYLPALVRDGFRGPIYATKSTVALSAISLPDSGRLQEEDARMKRKHGKPDAQALYNEHDAFNCLKSFQAVPYDTFQDLPGKMKWRYQPAGHILGSAFAEIYFESGERIMMSGDLGRYNTPIIKDPTPVDFAEYLVVESTYGDRIHPKDDPTLKLEQVLNDAYETGSAVIVPSFAIGRTQELLYYISILQKANRIKRVPIYVDSPMATSVTHLFEEAKDEWDDEAKQSFAEKIDLLDPEGLHFVQDREASKELNSQKGPLMIIAGSGMANGGRVIHHLMHRLGNASTTVLFTGYQAVGTLGRDLIEGKSPVRMYGQEIEVKAKIDKLNSLSAHADQGEILNWLKGFKTAPKKTFIVHGEPPAQLALQAKIQQELGWSTEIPDQGDSFEI